MRKPVIYIDRRLKWWECLIVAARLRIRPSTVRKLEAAAHGQRKILQRAMADAMIFRRAHVVHDGKENPQ